MIKRAILPVSICFWLTGAALAQEQKVSVDLKQRPLTELFSTIEKQTPYRFSYRDVVLQGKGNVTISEQNVSTREVLANALHPLGLDFELQSEKNIVIFNRTEAKTSRPSGRSKKIKGTITDSSGVPIIGANVMVKGTTNGTITDLDGNFSLDVSEGDILEIRVNAWRQIFEGQKKIFICFSYYYHMCTWNTCWRYGYDNCSFCYEWFSG